MSIEGLVDWEMPPKLLIYAASGAGKTVLAATAADVPELNPVLMLDVEGQYRSIKSKQRLIDKVDIGKDHIPGIIDRIRMRKWQDVCDTYEYLFDSKFKDVKSSYKTIIIDSITDINDKAIEQATGGPFKNLQVPAPKIQHYGEGHWILKQMMNGFRDMEGLVVIYTALTKDQEAVDSEIQMLKPNLTGQMSEQACAKSEFVGYLYSDNTGKRWLQFKKKGRIYAKWRDESKEPADMPEPTIEKFLKLLKENQ